MTNGAHDLGCGESIFADFQLRIDSLELDVNGSVYKFYNELVGFLAITKHFKNNTFVIH